MLPVWAIRRSLTIRMHQGRRLRNGCPVSARDRDDVRQACRWPAHLSMVGMDERTAASPSTIESPSIIQHPRLGNPREVGKVADVAGCAAPIARHDKHKDRSRCSNTVVMEMTATRDFACIAVGRAKPSIMSHRRFSWTSRIRRISWWLRRAANATTTFQSTKNIWPACSNASSPGVLHPKNCIGPRLLVSCEGIPRSWPDCNVHGRMLQKALFGQPKTIV